MKKLHLICNAHIDPIWQWTWDEGISSAIATFKSAADLAEEFDYIFCHNEAMLYEAIEECAPDLFERIKKLVQQGKWKITGGWYLQPDCNMPAGETFVRQISVGKKYFKEKFGVEPTIAYNFDAFGHSLGLVQILAKNGYMGYMACRPRNGDQFTYPGRFFKWESPDGSSVIVTNSGSYGTLLGEAAAKIYAEATGGTTGMLGSSGTKKIDAEEVNYSLWGVGNHGGGPSRKDLRDIAAMKIDGMEIMHSTPEALFADNIKISGTVNKSLITCMPGCYSSMARVKQAYRRTENLFYATEKMLLAAKLNGVSIDDSEMRKAEKKLLLATFHDILPGTCVPEGEKEGLCALSYAERILMDYRTKAFLRMAMAQKPAGTGEFPVFVFNYAPYELNAPVEVEFMLENQNWNEQIRFNPHVYFEGKEIPCQTVKEESTLNLDWRKKVVFEAKLAPMSLTRFEIKVSADERVPMPLAQEYKLEKAWKWGESKPVFEIYEDTADPWGMSAEELLAMGKNPVEMRAMTSAEVKAFCALDKEIPSERRIEDGAVLSAYEGLYTNGLSNVVLQYKAYKNHAFTDLKVVAEFAEKNKLLRIKIPMPAGFENARAVGDGPFVIEDKPNTECVFQKWFGVQRDDGKIFAVVNDGVYAGKVENGYIHLTLLRGAGYCFHPINDKELYPQDRYLPRIDGGRYAFNLRLVTGDALEVTRCAEEFNQLAYAVNVFPTGTGDNSFAKVSLQGNVMLVNTHVNAQGEYVARIFNPTDNTQAFSLQIGETTINGEASKAEVVTVVYKDGDGIVLHDKMPV